MTTAIICLVTSRRGREVAMPRGRIDVPGQTRRATLPQRLPRCRNAQKKSSPRRLGDAAACGVTRDAHDRHLHSGGANAGQPRDASLGQCEPRPCSTEACMQPGRRRARRVSASGRHVSTRKSLPLADARSTSVAASLNLSGRASLAVHSRRWRSVAPTPITCSLSHVAILGSNC